MVRYQCEPMLYSAGGALLGDVDLLRLSMLAVVQQSCLTYTLRASRINIHRQR
jgi:hypothetical protein